MSNFLKRLFSVWNNPVSHPQDNISFQRDNSDWKALFDDASVITNGPKQIREAQDRLMIRLSQAYQVYERISREEVSLLKGIIQAVDYCEGLDPCPREIKAVRELLLSILNNQGVISWSPIIGKPVPEGCEPISEEISADFSSQTILKVLTPGYLWKDSTVIRRPRVVVSKQPSKDISTVSDKAKEVFNGRSRNRN